MLIFSDHLLWEQSEPHFPSAKHSLHAGNGLKPNLQVLHVLPAMLSLMQLHCPIWLHVWKVLLSFPTRISVSTDPFSLHPHAVNRKHTISLVYWFLIFMAIHTFTIRSYTISIFNTFVTFFPSNVRFTFALPSDWKK